jgi:hypothetical protein
MHELASKEERMKSKSVTIAILIYLYLGCKFLQKIYNALPASEKERRWNNLWRPLVMVALWPLHISVIILVNIPEFIYNEVVNIVFIFFEIKERGRLNR